MTPDLICETGTIAPYIPSEVMPWNSQRVLHLYRRLGFGTSPQQVQNALLQDPGVLIDSIIDEAIAMPLSPQPEWAYWAVPDYDNIDQAIEQILSWNLQWMNDMLNNGFREKLALFWHNHFVTQLEVYQCPSYMYQYHKLLQQYAVGNFKDFVHDIGITPAMLVYLNGVQSTYIEPNENYGRELYELFTLGRDNGYTQTDIVETAKALTGWNGLIVGCGPIGYLDAYHDHTEKTIFGQTGDWGYDDVINILFEQRQNQVAQYICTKIYNFFVSPDTDYGIVNEMATTFKNNNFELAPVFRQLFKSEHFFDENIIGSCVKSPFEIMFNFLKEGNFSYGDQVLESAGYLAGMLGQRLFDPVDVAGWQGNHDWINSNTLTGRWQILTYFIGGVYENNTEELRNLAISLVNDSNDPEFITRTIVDYFLPKGLQTEAAYNQAITVFKAEVPQNYYDNGLWNLLWDSAPGQVGLLLLHISKIPEFQLL